MHLEETLKISAYFVKRRYLVRTTAERKEVKKILWSGHPLRHIKAPPAVQTQTSHFKPFLDRR